MPADAARTGYREAIRRFQRNAKLYLIYSALSSVNSSIFLVAFAFYLEELYNPTGNPAATVRFLGVPMLVPPFIRAAGRVPGCCGPCGTGLGCVPAAPSAWPSRVPGAPPPPSLGSPENPRRKG